MLDDPPYLLVSLAILFGVYFKSRNLIPSQERDTDSNCRLVDPLDSLPFAYQERTVYPQYRNTDLIHHCSTDTTETLLNPAREVEVRFPCGSCDSVSGGNTNVNVEPELEGVEFT